MDSTFLRVDWYSFVLGSQVSTVSGILAPAVSTRFRVPPRLRFAREYLHPSVVNGGETIFFFRIKDPGNMTTFGLKLLINIFERNLVGGCIYALMNKYLDTKSDSILTRAFTHGAILGACCSLKYDYRNSLCDTVLGALSSGQVASTGEEIRQLLISTGTTQDNLHISLPSGPMSFWNGAFTRCILALYFNDIPDYFDFIEIPEFDDTDTRMDVLLGYSQYFYDIIKSTVKFTFTIAEKLIVGGVVYCAAECALKRATGWTRPSVILLIGGSAVGIYSGLYASIVYLYSWSRIKKAWRLSLLITALCHLFLKPFR